MSSFWEAGIQLSTTHVEHEDLLENGKIHCTILTEEVYGQYNSYSIYNQYSHSF